MGPPTALFLFGAYQLVLRSAVSFHNHRLGSLLVVLGLLALLLGCALLWGVVFSALTRDYELRWLQLAQAALRWLAWPLALGALLFLSFHNREGLTIGAVD